MSDQGHPPGKNLRHDLRTPINQILGYSEMLQEEATDAGQEERFNPDLQKINAAARTLLGLIDRIPDAVLTGGGPAATAAVAAPVPAPAPVAPAMPARVDAPAPQPKAAARPAATEGKARLLVVDDNEMNRDMLSRRLKARGFRVETAEDGQHALDMIAAEPYDLILLDIMMPVLSGLDVLKILRVTHSVAELPIIMATAKDQGEDIVEALSLGANDYVTKPLDFPVVLARTETQLKLKRAMEEIKRLADQLELRNRFIQKTFGRYLSAEVVENLLDDPEGLKLGGEKRPVTLMMSDLRGFTAMAEVYSGEQVVRTLNHYLGTMADIITSYQGTIDEFIGDAIFALFGAPVAREDDAERAAACAVAMQLAMNDVNEHNRLEGLPELNMGIAVNTGEVIVGNIGSTTRAKYGVVGSHVNLTGRIESFTVGGQILVSESTFQKAEGALKVGERTTFQAKGFKDPVAVYNLLGVAGRHGLFLPEQDDHLQALARELPVTFAALEGKHAQGEQVAGTLVMASKTGAEVRSLTQPSALTNLRLRLLPTDGPEVPGDLYAKVLSAPASGEGMFRIRFTSVDPPVEKALLALLG